MPLHSSLGDRARLHPKKKAKQRNGLCVCVCVYTCTQGFVCDMGMVEVWKAAHRGVSKGCLGWVDQGWGGEQAEGSAALE